MRSMIKPFLTLGLLVSCAASSHAQGITFAQFTEANTATQGFAFTSAAGFDPITGIAATPGMLGVNNGAGTPSATTTLPVVFRFGALAPTIDQNIGIDALLTLTAETNTPAFAIAGQVQQQFFNLTATFSALSSIAGTDIVAGSNLLTLTSGVATMGFTNGGSLGGGVGGQSLGLTGSDNIVGGFNNQVTYTSSYIDFTGAFPNDSYSLSFTSVAPSVGFTGTIPFISISSFTSSGTGTFASVAVPEPGVMALLFAAGISGSVFQLRRRRRA